MSVGRGLIRSGVGAITGVALGLLLALGGTALWNSIPGTGGGMICSWVPIGSEKTAICHVVPRAGVSTVTAFRDGVCFGMSVALSQMRAYATANSLARRCGDAWFFEDIGRRT